MHSRLSQAQLSPLLSALIPDETRDAVNQSNKLRSLLRVGGNGTLLLFEDFLCIVSNKKVEVKIPLEVVWLKKATSPFQALFGSTSGMLLLNGI